jgi:hypothetical protein
MTMKTTTVLPCACAVALLGSATTTLAQRGDPPAIGYNLEPGFPTDLVDAFALDPKVFAAQGFVRYEQTDNDQDRFLFRPKVAYGIAPYAHIEASVAVFSGDADRTGSGDIRLGAHYQFLDEAGVVPAMAIIPGVEIPTGKDSRGLDTSLTLAVTRSLNLGDGNDRIHFNASWLRNAGSNDFEREHYYRVAFGYSRQFMENLTLVADFVREEQRVKKQEANIIEAGAAYQFDDHMTGSLSLGFGIAAESPDFRIGSGFQWTF